MDERVYFDGFACYKWKQWFNVNGFDGFRNKWSTHGVTKPFWCLSAPKPDIPIGEWGLLGLIWVLSVIDVVLIPGS
jgi:hypothetical protein